MKYFTVILFLLASLHLSAKPKKDVIKDSTKVSVKFGGRVDVSSYFDTYNSVEARNGVQYWFPKSAQFNAEGVDLNFENRLRFSVATTRLNVTLSVPKLGKSKATAKAFVEADFMGITENVLSSLRLRHAYFAINWKNQSLLMGQTSHLVMIDDIAPSVVTFGGGFPINTLNRPIQFRFTQRFGNNASFDIAASMLAGNDCQMQATALVPDIHARLNFGSKKHRYGIAGGFKILKPRTITADSSRATKSFLSFDVAAYYRATFNQHTLTVYAIWGQNANALALIGGYAARLVDKDLQDYRYAPTSAISGWIDYQTPQWDGFSVGCFVGAQKNLGSMYKLDLSNANIPNIGIDAFIRVAPRVLYNYKMLTFGLEYMYSVASWAKQMNDYYKPVSYYNPTSNHRLTLLARFSF